MKAYILKGILHADTLMKDSIELYRANKYFYQRLYIPSKSYYITQKIEYDTSINHILKSFYNYTIEESSTNPQTFEIDEDTTITIKNSLYNLSSTKNWNIE